jgi:hypothetical protein
MPAPHTSHGLRSMAGSVGQMDPPAYTCLDRGRINMGRGSNVSVCIDRLNRLVLAMRASIFTHSTQFS